MSVDAPHPQKPTISENEAFEGRAGTSNNILIGFIMQNLFMLWGCAHSSYVQPRPSAAVVMDYRCFRLIGRLCNKTVLRPQSCRTPALIRVIGGQHIRMPITCIGRDYIFQGLHQLFHVGSPSNYAVVDTSTS